MPNKRQELKEEEEDYIENLIEKVNKLSSHHYIAKNLKENLQEDECIVLLRLSSELCIHRTRRSPRPTLEQCPVHPSPICSVSAGSS